MRPIPVNIRLGWGWSVKTEEPNLATYGKLNKKSARDDRARMTSTDLT